jgi:DNA repair exonuclease SbcCD ATPase subunit
MLTFNKAKPTTTDTTAIETELAERVKDLTDAKAAFRRARERRDDAGAALSDSPHSEVLAAQVRDIERELEDRRQFVERAHDAMNQAERKLDRARTAPLRKENTAKVRHRAKTLGDSLSPAKLALSRVIEAMDNVSPDLTFEVGPQMFRQMITSAYSALLGGDAERWITDMHKRADAIESGDASAGLRLSPAEEAAALRKAG